MLNKCAIFICLCLMGLDGFAVSDTFPTVNRQRVWLVAGVHAAVWTGSYIALDKAWYADYPRTAFHFFNDNAEWNQMDKAGHVWSSYQVSRASAELWKWTGMNRSTGAILGSASGMLYQSIIELQDAYSSDWGFSWGDMGANLTGAGLYVFQELKWHEQRLQVKMGYWPADYPGELASRRDQLFGSSFMERVLKDYNSQTYWLSANIASFFPSSKAPRWLNIAFGYGAEGMYGARKNSWLDKEGAMHDYAHICRKRLFYLAPDIDLTRVPTKSKLLKSVFFVLSMVKVPAPALRLDSDGKFSLRALQF